MIGGAYRKIPHWHWNKYILEIYIKEQALKACKEIELRDNPYKSQNPKTDHEISVLR